MIWSSSGSSRGLARLGLRDLDKLSKRRRERPSSVLNRKLNWDATLDRDLIEVARAGVIRVNVSFCSSSATLRLAHCVLIVFVSIFENPDLLFDFFLLVGHPHFRIVAAIGVEVVYPVLVRLVRTFDQLVPGLAAEVGLAGQHTILVVHRCRIFPPVLTKTTHGVKLEIVGLCAAEHGWLLGLEQNFGLLACLLLGLGIDQRALSVVADVFLDLLFLVFDPVVSPLTAQNTVHGGKLIVGDGRLILAVP